MSKPTVVVTGGAGFIGSAVADALIRAGNHVIIADNLSGGDDKGLLKEAEFHNLSILDTQGLTNLLRTKSVDAVFHMAALIKVGESVSFPEKYFQVNTEGTASVLRAMEAASVKNLVFSSTAAVYGQVTTDLVAENAPLTPMNPYGESKLRAEKLIHAHAQKHPDFRHIIFRYFNVAGSDLARGVGPHDPAPTQLVRRACQASLGVIPAMQVFGNDYETPDGTCIRDYIHAKDLAIAHQHGLDHLRAQPTRETLNVGYGRGRSVLEVLNAMKEVAGQPVPHTIEPRREGDPRAVVADSTKATRLLDLRWKHDSIVEICRDSYLWEKQLHRAPEARA